jgi:hypothetical protein
MLALLIAALLLSGCSQPTTPSEPIPFDKKPEANATPLPPEPMKTAAHKSSIELVRPPIEEKATFDSKGAGKVDLMDGIEGDVTFASAGNMKYKILEDDSVTGFGDGSVKVSVKGDISIAKCSGEKDVPITYKVKGTYDPETKMMKYEFYDIKPKTTTINMKCPSQYGGDLEYTLDFNLPMDFKGEASVEDLRNKKTVTKKVLHPLEGWDTSISADWNFRLVPAADFDFKVDIADNFKNVSQDSTANMLVHVNLIKHLQEAQAGPVALQVTDWQSQGITTTLAPRSVTPTSTATLQVKTTCNTGPGDYLFTVRGDSASRSSQDAVTVKVVKNPKC